MCSFWDLRRYAVAVAAVAGRGKLKNVRFSCRLQWFYCVLLSIYCGNCADDYWRISKLSVPKIVNKCAIMVTLLKNILPVCFFETQVKVKVKVMSIYIASIHETSPRRSGIARIVNGYHGFTCKPCVSSASRMRHTCLCLASRSWYYYFPTSEGWKAE